MAQQPRQMALLCTLTCALFASSPAWAAPAILSGPTLTMNPNGTTPLAGLLTAVTDVPSQLRITVSSAADTWSNRFSEIDTNHATPVLGLKPDTAYTIDVSFVDAAGEWTDASPPLQVVTPPLPADFPIVDVLVSQPEKMEPGYTLLDSFGRGAGGTGGQYQTIFDARGEVVWYSTRPASATLRLPDGNLLVRAGSVVLERDLLGNDVSQVPLAAPGVLHHDLFPTPDSYLSLTHQTVVVEDFPTSDTDPDAPTQTADVRDDPVVEFGLDGSLLHVWPLTELIDPTRIGYASLGERPDGYDWAHANAVLYDARDDSIIVSIRHQDAVVEFSRSTGELQWILGTHANWKPEFQPFLLEPVGALAWQYHQHAPMLTDDGTLVLFDNGNGRASPFDGTSPLPSTESVSRAVEIAIDEEQMQVSQVWEYGAGPTDEQLYSYYISDADRQPRTKNTLITYGGTIYENGVSSPDLGQGDIHTRIIEVDHDTPAEKVFDLRLYDPAGSITVYRSERIPSLYPDHSLWPETSGRLRCGLGPELAALIPLLQLRRRRLKRARERSQER